MTGSDYENIYGIWVSATNTKTGGWKAAVYMKDAIAYMKDAWAYVKDTWASWEYLYIDFIVTKRKCILIKTHKLWLVYYLVLFFLLKRIHYATYFL